MLSSSLGAPRFIIHISLWRIVIRSSIHALAFKNANVSRFDGHDFVIRLGARRVAPICPRMNDGVISICSVRGLTF